MPGPIGFIVLGAFLAVILALAGIGAFLYDFLGLLEDDVDRVRRGPHR